jgi:hypothetical protein
MRIQGKLRLGFFPLPLIEARRIRVCLRYPDSPCSAIDPCIGDGAAFLGFGNGRVQGAARGITPTDSNGC